MTKTQLQTSTRNLREASQGIHLLTRLALVASPFLILALYGCGGGEARSTDPVDQTHIPDYLASCNEKADGVVPTDEKLAVKVIRECAWFMQFTDKLEPRVVETLARALENYALTAPEQGLLHAPVLIAGGDALRFGFVGYTTDYWPYPDGEPVEADMAKAVACARKVVATTPPVIAPGTAFASEAEKKAATDAVRSYWFARGVLAQDHLVAQVKPALLKLLNPFETLNERERGYKIVRALQPLYSYRNTVLLEVINRNTFDLALNLALNAMKELDDGNRGWAGDDARCSFWLLNAMTTTTVSDAKEKTYWYLTMPPDEEYHAEFSKNRKQILDAHERKDWLDMAKHLEIALHGPYRNVTYPVEPVATFIPFCAKVWRRQLEFLHKEAAQLTPADFELAMRIATMEPTTIHGVVFLSAKDIAAIRTLALANLTARRQRFLDGGHFALATMLQDRIAIFTPGESATDQRHAYLHERIAKRPRLTVCLKKGDGWDGTFLGETFFQDVAALGSMYSADLTFVADPSGAGRTVVIDETDVKLVDPVEATTTKKKIGSFLAGYHDTPVAVTNASVASYADARYFGYTDTLAFRSATRTDIETHIENRVSEETERFAYKEKTVRMGVSACVSLKISGGTSGGTVRCTIDNAAFDVVREGVPGLSDLGNKPYTLGDWGSFLRSSRQDLAMKIVDEILASRPKPELGATLTDDQAEDLAIDLYARAYDWPTMTTVIVPKLATLIPKPSMPNISVGYTWPLPYTPLAALPADFPGIYVVEGPGLRAAAIGSGTKGMVATVTPKGFSPQNATYLVRAVTEDGKPIATWPALIMSSNLHTGVITFGLMGQAKGLPVPKPASAAPRLDQPVILRGYPDSSRTEAAILNEMRGKKISSGTVTLRDNPIAGWTAQLIEPGPSVPSVLLAYDASGDFLGLGNVDSPSGTVSIPKLSELNDAVLVVQNQQLGW